MESEPILSPTDKFPMPEGLEEGRTGDAASHRIVCPVHCRLSYSGPQLHTEIRLIQDSN